MDKKAISPAYGGAFSGNRRGLSLPLVIVPTLRKPSCGLPCVFCASTEPSSLVPSGLAHSTSAIPAAYAPFSW